MQCACMQGESIFFSIELFTSLYHSWDCIFVLRRGNTLEARNAVSYHAEVNSKCDSFYDLELSLNWSEHPSKESNAQASGVRL